MVPVTIPSYIEKSQGGNFHNVGEPRVEPPTKTNGRRKSTEGRQRTSASGDPQVAICTIIRTAIVYASRSKIPTYESPINVIAAHTTPPCGLTQIFFTIWKIGMVNPQK